MRDMKKLSFLICLVLIVSILAPIASIASAGKPNGAPPTLEKRVFIHYKRGYGRGPPPGGGSQPKEKGHSDHYELLGKGVKWRETPVSYIIDPDNPDGLPEGFIVAAITASAEEWDRYTSVDLFGAYSVDYSASWDDDAPDGANELVFGDYPREGVIAITIVWGYFSGPPGLREIVEFDVMFDTDYAWGDAAALGGAVMDLQDIATHELGHGAGLGDLYYCELETMYGYAFYGETMKRDLYAGDIAGIQYLYGK